MLADPEEEVVAEWIKRFKSDEAASVAELVNLALKSAGCSIGVDVDDIRDPDNASGRLTTIQEEFQAVSRLLVLFVQQDVANPIDSKIDLTIPLLLKAKVQHFLKSV